MEKESTFNFEKNIDTKEGNANIGNSVGDNANFGKIDRKIDSNVEKQINNSNTGSGNFFAGAVNNRGPANFGVNHGSMNQTNYDTNPNAEIEKLLDRAISKLDDKGKTLLRKVHRTIRNHVRKDADWQDDSDLDEDISTLYEQLANDLTYSEIQKICHAEAERERAKLVMRIEQPPK